MSKKKTKTRKIGLPLKSLDYRVGIDAMRLIGIGTEYGGSELASRGILQWAKGERTQIVLQLTNKHVIILTPSKAMNARGELLIKAELQTPETHS